MVTSHRLSSDNILAGLWAGLVGGLVFGVMMGMMGMLPMIGQMIGLPNPAIGFGLHMIISAVIGIGFGILFGPWSRSVWPGAFWGLFYGVIWWFLGGMTLMPLFLGMPVAWLTMQGLAGAFPSLIGHLTYGLITGGLYGLLHHRAVIPHLPQPQA